MKYKPPCLGFAFGLSIPFLMMITVILSMHPTWRSSGLTHLGHVKFLSFSLKKIEKTIIFLAELRNFQHIFRCMCVCIYIYIYIYIYNWKKNSTDHHLAIINLFQCPWCNGYRRRKWTRRHEFKSWTKLIGFHIALIPLGKVWIQLFSLQLWVNSRADWVLQPWWSN